MKVKRAVARPPPFPNRTCGFPAYGSPPSQPPYGLPVDAPDAACKIGCLKIGDKEGIASSLGNLRIIAENQGDYASARTYHDENLAMRDNQARSIAAARSALDAASREATWSDGRAMTLERASQYALDNTED